MSTHPKYPRDTYICSNPACRHTAANHGKCRRCGHLKFLNPDRGKPRPTPSEEAKP